MYAEIITIGDEILIGQIVDTNSALISQELNKIGVSVYQITSVQDDKQHILKSLQEAEDNADIIIITGGLGPTKDDITKKTLAEYFDDVLVSDPDVLKNIERIWREYIKQPIQQVNKDQALVPSKSEALMNLYGSAPGMWIEKNGKTVISLPGVPFEMKSLMHEQVLPKLKERYNFPSIHHKTLLTYGIGESRLASRIEEWEDHLPGHIKLAYLPNLGKVRLRLSAKGPNKQALEQEVDRYIQKVLPLIEDVFVGYQDLNESIEDLLAKALIEKGETLSVVESCTGGNISQLLTAKSGASAFFNGSLVTYSSSSKVDVLGLDKSLIEKNSVVSAEVAEAMATNCNRIYKTHYAIATTGNAGPTKGDSDAEIGTVFIAIATPSGVFSNKFTLGNHRKKVIDKATNKAFEMLYKEILKK